MPDHKHPWLFLTSLWSAYFGSLTVSHIQTWMGILSGAAVFVYTAIRIRGELQDQRRKREEVRRE